MGNSGSMHVARDAIFGAVVAVALLSGCGGDDGSNSSPVVLRILDNQMLVANAVGSPGSQSALLTGFEFEVPEPLAALGGSAAAYEIIPNEPADDRLAQLAESFGVIGTFVAQPSELGGGLMAGPSDGTAPMLSVMGDAMRVWSYSPAWADLGETECFEPDASAEMGTGELSAACSQTTPPQNLPSFDEAEEMFAVLMTELGVPTDDFIVEVSGDEWGVTVSGIKRVDGVRSPFTWSVTYGENGSIVSAFGVFNDDLRKIGEFPRLTTDEALSRLRDEQDSATSFGSGTDFVQPESGVTPVARLEAVEEELYILYGLTGEVYLVPGYTFVGKTANEGFALRFIVSAVPEMYIERVEESRSDGPDPSEGGSSPGSPGDGVTIPPGDDPIVDFPEEIPLEEANALLGMTEAEASTYAQGQGWTVRVASRDGEQFALTMDYMPQRVNLSIDQGLVTYVFIG